MSKRDSAVKNSSPAFQKSQYQLTRHLRDPYNSPAPNDIEDRRLQIYRDLIFNNIESFISSGFPVLRSLYKEDAWHTLVRQFLAEHRCKSPYFLEISQEFLHFLQNKFTQPPADKPFLLELAHYEWVELALSIATERLPDTILEPLDESWQTPLAVSSLSWRLSYQFPVHRIGPDFQPDLEPDTPTFLVVYRNAEDNVKFMEINAVTSRLLQLFEENAAITGEQGLQLIAEELSQPFEALQGFGHALLKKFCDADVLYQLRSNN